ncbi:MAG: hypothetical protein JJE19_04995 [Methanosarcinales archaeon]|nr:hypothetical protein [Methanosarcinales archaeon]
MSGEREHYHFDYRNTEYRIAYRIVENKNRIEIVLVKTRGTSPILGTPPT